MSHLASILLLLASVSACAPPLSPGLNNEVKSASVTPQGVDSVALMRQQGEQFANMPFVSGNQVDLLVDGAWSAVGSSNLDWRSAIWNNEIDAIVLGPSFGQPMEALFTRDTAASHRIDAIAWRSYGPVQCSRELKASLLDRLL